MSSHRNAIVAVRANLVDRRGGAAYTDQEVGHWIIDTKLATPLSGYPQWRNTRRSWGIDVLGTVLVEVEDGAGNIGIGVSTGGEPACFLIERHFARFCVGNPPSCVEDIWEQMFRASQYYGRRGLALNAISAVDLAVWDLLGHQRHEPVHSLIGGKVREDIPAYATGPDPAFARTEGFIGAKIPLVAGPAEGEEGMRENVAQAEYARSMLGDDQWLALDCYMAFDVEYTLRLIEALRETAPAWLEEFLLPDDYWGYREVRQRRPWPIDLAMGEHEATPWGFRLLLDYECADLLQPDVTWCGGMTALLRIADLADQAKVPVVPHGSGPYAYHFVVTRPSTQFAEFVVMSANGDELVPTFTPLLDGEPLPRGGRVTATDEPGFGLTLADDVSLHRPFPNS